MEQIKDIIKNQYELLIITICALFVIGVVFLSTHGSGIGIFATTGNIFSSLIEEKIVISENMRPQQSLGSGYVPNVQYEAGTQKTGECVELKSLFSVKFEDGRCVNGREEDGFVIYLKDICTSKGKSVLEFISTYELTQMEEIPATFIYDRDLDLLYIFGSGVYFVSIRVYADDGSMETYEFQLPIEAS